MNITNGLRKLCDTVNKIIYYIVAVLFAITLVSCTIQVFTRYVLNNSATWTDEVSRFSFIWATMLGATICSWTYGHAVISFVVDRFPKKLNALFRIISEIIVIGISFILIVYSPRILQVSAIQKSPALQLPMFYIYISVPICGCLFILYSISHICDIIYNDFFNKNKEVLS